MPRYQIWGIPPEQTKATGHNLKAQGSIMANDIREASRKVRDRTGRPPVLITRGMEDGLHLLLSLHGRKSKVTLMNEKDLDGWERVREARERVRGPSR